MQFPVTILAVRRTANRAAFSASFVHSVGVKRIPLNFLALVAVAFLVFGCATSLDETAYRSIGASSALVDGSMQGWGAYVKSGAAGTGDEATIRGLYIEYQAAMATASGVVRAYRIDPDRSREALTKSVLAVEDAAGRLTTSIATLTAKRQ